MKAKVTIPFSGVKDGEIYPRKWNIGEEIEGDLARSAVDAGNAKALGGPAENKMLEGVPGKTGGRTGGGKLSASPRRGRPKVESK